MRHFFLFWLSVFLISFFLVSCSGKRPFGENFSVNISGFSILKNGKVSLSANGEVIASEISDEKGNFKFQNIHTASDFVVEVCGGTFYNAISESEINFSGCLESVVIPNENDIEIVVDFLSTFASKYRSETSLKEWLDYLSLATDAEPVFVYTLTDSTKRWLWQEAFSKIADDISKANNVSAEAQFSTEQLFKMLIDDLMDDNVINGSTDSFFGGLKISADVLKNVTADALPLISERFGEAELKDWSDGIRNSNAKFLAPSNTGNGGGDAELSLKIEIYPEGNKAAKPEYFSGVVVVEAVAESSEAVLSLECFKKYSDSELKLEDENIENQFFEGRFDTEIETGEIVVRCEAKNGVTTKVEEKSILVDNTAPTVKAFFYEHGTHIETATKENPGRKSIDVQVSASHPTFAIESMICTIENYNLTNNSENADSQLKAVVDTIALPEGRNVLHCAVSVNFKEFIYDFEFYVMNTVEVTVKPYITNPLFDFNNISFICGEDGDLTGNTHGEDKIRVRLGEICTVSVSGGKYKPVVSTDENEAKQFNGVIKTVIIPESNADIVVTPLTSVVADIYFSQVAAGKDKLSVYLKSRERILNHLSNAFEWWEEPENTNALDSKTKHFILLAGLEYLPYFLELHLDSEHGKYNIVNVLEVLEKDYSDLVFDGFNKEKQLFFGEENPFAVDSNFFRYYYALAIKRFMLSDYNTTGFVGFGNIINQISTNTDQFLFPADVVPISIESEGPDIEILSFVNLSEKIIGNSEDLTDEIVGDLAVYSRSESEIYSEEVSIPYFAKAFLFNIKIAPHNGNYIDLNSVEVAAVDSESVFNYKRLLPENIENDGFSNKEMLFRFLVEYDDYSGLLLEKTVDFAVRVQDIAFNHGSAEIKGFLDNKPPILDLRSNQNITNGNDQFQISWSVSDNRVEKINYFLLKKENSGNNEIVELSSDTVAMHDDLFQTFTFSAEKILEKIEYATVSGLISEKDGEYIFKVSAEDFAGNRTEAFKEFSVDTTPPKKPRIQMESNGKNIVMGDVIKEDGFDVSVASPMNEDEEKNLEDIALWTVKFDCKTKNSNLQKSFVKDYVASNKTISFSDLLRPNDQDDLSTCKGFISACDRVNNCVNQNFSESSGCLVIDNQPPFFEGYDKERTILSECITNNGAMFITLPCAAQANCSQNSDVFFFTKLEPQVLLGISDNYDKPENLNVFIQSLELGWIRQCSYIPNKEDGGNCNVFYCDLRGAYNGNNNFKIRAFDGVGNYSETSLVLAMNFSVAEHVNIDVAKFFTDKTRPTIKWNSKNGVAYECVINKKGTNFSKTCDNNFSINPKVDLDGSGYYTVTVTGNSQDSQVSDSVEFKYFDTDDFSFTLTPVKGQFLKAGENFKVKIAADSKGLAEISNVELYIFGRYLNGELQNNTDFLILKKTFDDSNWLIGVVSSLNATYYAQIPNNIQRGQFRNMKARITFSDGSYIERYFKRNSVNSFLYCLLDNNEAENKGSITFRNEKLDIYFYKPDCVSVQDYSLNLNAEYPQKCSSYFLQSKSFFWNKVSENRFVASGKFVFYKSKEHTHAEDDGWMSGDEICTHSCTVEKHTFGAGTKLQVKYNSGVTAEILPDNSVNFNAETAKIGSDPLCEEESFTAGDCHKCDGVRQLVVECSETGNANVQLIN